MATPTSARSKGFAPINQLPAAQKVLEGQRLALTGLRVSDADAADTTISVTLSVTHGSLFISPTSGVTLSYANDGGRVVLAGSQTDINKALGSLIYTPTPYYNGSDTLTMTSSDRGNTSGTEQLDTDALAITVVSVNDAPTASNRVFVTKEDTALVLKAVNFDFRDVDGHALAAVKIVSLPTNGTLLYKGIAISASKVAAGFEVSAADLTAGKLTFMPAKDGNSANTGLDNGQGYASFQFQVRDTGGNGNGGKDTSTSIYTARIEVTPVNDGPVAGNDAGVASPVLPALGQVLSNDIDAEGDRLSVTGIGLGLESSKPAISGFSGGTSVQGKYGTLLISADGSYRYTVNASDPDYKALKGGSATENFTYRVSDGNGGSDLATLAIKVTSPNTGPQAQDDVVQLVGNSITQKVLGNDSDADGDRLVVSRVGVGSEASNAGNPTGQPVIPPNPLQAIATGLSLKGQYGVLTLKSDGSYSYLIDTKSPDYIALGRDATGADSFTYEVSDGRGGSDRATLTVRVKGVNDNPEASNDFAREFNRYDEGSYYNNVLWNDRDIDYGDSLVVNKVGPGPQVSTLVLNQEDMPATVVAGKYGFLSMRADGYYSYRTDPANAAFRALDPDGSYTETFSYEISDGKGGSSKAQITVSFLGPNGTPEAVDDAATASLLSGASGAQSFVASGNVIDNDLDLEDDALYVVAAGAGTEASNTGDELSLVPGYLGAGASGLNIEGKFGTLHIEQNGNYFYSVNTSDEDFQKLGQGATATDNFTYEVIDSRAGDRATLAIKVTGLNDAPDAVNDTTLLAKADNGATGNVLSNDIDIDSGDTLSVSSAKQSGDYGTLVTSSGTSFTGTYGTLTLKSDGSYSYALNRDGASYKALTEGVTATDSFTYTAKDANGATDTATLKVTVTGSNNPPVAYDDSGAQTLTQGGAGSPPEMNPGPGSTGPTPPVVDLDNTTLAVDMTKKVTYVPGTGGVLIANKIDISGTTAGPILSLLNAKAGDVWTYNGQIVPSFGLPIGNMSLSPSLSGDTLGLFLGGGNASEQLAVMRLIGFTTTSTDTSDRLIKIISNGSAGTTYSYVTVGISTAEPAKLTDTGNVLTNDTDANNDVLTVTSAGAGKESDAPTLTTLTNHDADSSGGGTGTPNQATLEGKYGSLVIKANGSYEYTLATSDGDYKALAKDATATESFTYEISDGKGGTDKATLSLTVKGVNDAPVAVDDTITQQLLAGIASGASGTVLFNDTDVDTGDKALLTVTQAGLGAESTNPTLTSVASGLAGTNIAGKYGTLSLNANGSYSYIVDGSDVDYQKLAKDDTATEAFTYAISDGKGGTDKATVSFTVKGVNDAPVAENDSAELKLASNQSVDRTTEIFKDIELSLAGSSYPVTLKAGHSYTYTFTGNGAFLSNPSLTLSTVSGNTVLATKSETTTAYNATVTVTYTNSTGADINAKIAYTSGPNGNGGLLEQREVFMASTEAELSKTGNVLTNDTDIDTGDKALLTVTRAGKGDESSAPTLGSVVTGSTGTSIDGTYGTLVIKADGSYTYTLNAEGDSYKALGQGVSATDNFTYEVSDGKGGSDKATLAIKVSGINDAPVAGDDAGSKTLSATDLPSQPVISILTTADAASIQQIQHVTVYTFAVPTAAGASHSFSLGITETVQPIGIFLVAGQPPFSPENPGRQLSSAPYTLGTSALTVSYTNALGLMPGEGLYLALSTGQLAGNTPIAFNITAVTGPYLVPLDGSVLTNDTDADTGDVLSVTQARTGLETVPSTLKSLIDHDNNAVTQKQLTLEGTYGDLVIKADGSYSYTLDTSDADYRALNGGITASDSFTYVVSDGKGGSDTATLSLKVEGVNDAPVAVNDSTELKAARQEAGGTFNFPNYTFGAGNVIASPKLLPGHTYVFTATDAVSLVLQDANGNVVAPLSGTTTSITYVYNGSEPANFKILANGAKQSSFITIGLSDTSPSVDQPAELTKSGNVLTNDTDVDTGDKALLKVTKAGVGAEDATTPPTLSTLTDRDSDISTPNTLKLTGSYGTLNINADGSYTYDLDTTGDGYKSLGQGISAIDSFTYVVADPSGATDTATLAIKVNGLNDAPVANDDAGSKTLTAADAVETIVPAGLTAADAANVILNFDNSDAYFFTIPTAAGSTHTYTASGNAMTVFLIAVDSQKQLSSARFLDTAFGADRTVTYANTNGLSETESLVLVVNVALNATPDFIVVEGTDASNAGTTTKLILSPLEGDVLDNDTDIDVGDKALLKVTGVRTGEEHLVNDAPAGDIPTAPVTAPELTTVPSGSTGVTIEGTYGDLVIKADGSYRYVLDTNDADYRALNGGITASESFTYVVSDGKGGSDTATLSLKVEGVNDAPEAKDDSAALAVAGAGEIIQTEVQLLSGTINNSSQSASITLQPGHQYVFSYGGGGSSSAATGTFELTANGVSLFPARDMGAGGSYTFTYEGNAPLVAQAIAKTTVAVSFMFGLYYSESIASSVTELSKTGNVLSNDLDADTGDKALLIVTKAGKGAENATTPPTLTALSDTDNDATTPNSLSIDGTYGSLVIKADGSYTYTLNAEGASYKALAKGVSATESFTYEVSDRNGATDKATLAVKVTGINDAIVAEDDTATLAIGATTVSNPASINGGLLGVLANDSDVDVGDTKTVVAAGAGAESRYTGESAAVLPALSGDTTTLTGTYGSLVLKNDGSYTYTLNTSAPDYKAMVIGDTATDSFTYAVTDSAGSRDTATLAVSLTRTIAPVDLNQLNSSNGLKLNSVVTNDTLGFSVSSAGDVNGDGYDDVIIGAPAAPRGTIVPSTYVLFGAGGSATANYVLSSLSSTEGFKITGEAKTQLGISVSSAGDVNGDGYDDLIVGQPVSNTAYVVFGGNTLGSAGPLNVSALTGTNGFKLEGLPGGASLGLAVSSAGDINGDGYDDLLVGAPTHNTNFGAAYIVYGSASVGSSGSINLSNQPASAGINVSGTVPLVNLGGALSSAGDVNGDGYEDVIVASSGQNAGASSYVVFGGSNLSSLNETALTGSNGFKLVGRTSSVSSAGDINGDGFDDLVVADAGADLPGRMIAGASYVVFGGAGLGSSGSVVLATLDGSNGFKLLGAAANAQSGFTVSEAGDVNGDGYGDLIVGSLTTAQVVFGGANVASSGTLDLANINGINGFRLAGATAPKVSSAGDVNGDGFDDLVIGTAAASGVTGNSYIVYGFATGRPVDNVFTGTEAAETLNGGLGNDRLDGGLGNDILIGGAGNDTLVYDAADTLRVDGGNGRDTLTITGRGVTLDLTALNNFGDANTAPASPYTNIEIIDITGSGNNTLKLNASDLLHIVGSATGTDLQRDNNLLRVDGNYGDTVQLTSGTWTVAAHDYDLNGKESPSSSYYTLYTSGQARLLIGKDVSVVLPPVPPAPPVAADDKITLGVLGASEVLTQDQPLLNSSAGADLNQIGTYTNTITLMPGHEYQFSLGGGGNGQGAATFELKAGDIFLISQEQIGAGGQVLSYTHQSPTPLVATGVVRVTGGNFSYAVNVTELQLFTETELHKSGNVLTNDTDANQDVPSVTHVGAGSESASPTLTALFDHDQNTYTPNQAALTGTYGSLVIQADGSYTYALDTSNPDYLALLPGTTASDSFSYVTNDGHGGSDTATLTVQVINSNGFRVTGASSYASAGASVSSAGDINGDGFDDFIIGAPGAKVTVDFFGMPYDTRAGSAYVVYGGADLAYFNLDPSKLTPAQGFKLDGTDTNGQLGRRVTTLGDINGDGFDDVLVTSKSYGYTNTSYVVLGRSHAENISTYPFTNAGFTISGLASRSGLVTSVSGGGDINGDGLDDFVLGVAYAGSNNQPASYVVFGSTNVTESLHLDALGNRGFSLAETQPTFNIGKSVSLAGDLNGDGYDDLVIGAPFIAGSINNAFGAGGAYVVFGGATVGASGSINLTNLVTGDGSAGYRLQAADGNQKAGYSLASVGDINGDGFDDLIVGAFLASSNGLTQNGSAYVVFGSATQAAGNVTLASLNGSNGFRMNGTSTYGNLGSIVSAAGDFNGDGYADFLVAEAGFKANGVTTGAAYLVFGGQQVGQSGLVDLAQLTPSTGIRFASMSYGALGSSLSSAGDVNGDGFDDLIIGAPYAAAKGSLSVGTSYIIYGFDTDPANNLVSRGSSGSDSISGFRPGSLLIGGAGDDQLVYYPSAAPRVDGGAGRDTLIVFGENATLDLTAMNNFTNPSQAPANAFQSIEIIDLTGSGNNTLKLNASDLLHLVGSATGSDGARDNNLLRVDGNAGDTVQLTSGSWSSMVSVNGDGDVASGGSYTLYTNGQAKLLVANAVSVALPDAASQPNELFVSANYHEPALQSYDPTVNGHSVEVTFSPAVNLVDFGPFSLLNGDPLKVALGLINGTSVSLAGKNVSYLTESNSLLIDLHGEDTETSTIGSSTAAYVQVINDSTSDSNLFDDTDGGRSVPSFALIVGTAERNSLNGADAHEAGGALIKDYLFSGGGDDSIRGGLGADVIYLENPSLTAAGAPTVTPSNQIVIRGLDQAGDVVYGYDANDRLLLDGSVLGSGLFDGSSELTATAGQTTLTADPFKLLMGNTVNTTVDSDHLSNLTDVAALFSAHFTFDTDRATDDALLVLQSSSKAGDFAVYAFDSAGDGKTIHASELALVAVVHSSDLGLAQFSSSVQYYD